MLPTKPINAMIEDVFATRFTCKRYDPERTVSDEDLNTILETGRLSPSSFGLEPWKFLVIPRESALTDKLREIAWGMKRNAPYSIVILARKHMEASSPHVAHMMTDVQGTSPEDFEQRKEVFANFQANDLGIAADPRLMFEWSCRQAYIALANMLTASALLHVDSTPVEGLNYEKVNELLANEGLMDPEEFGVAVMLQVGYHDPTHIMKPKTRQKAADVVEFLK